MSINRKRRPESRQAESADPAPLKLISTPSNRRRGVSLESLPHEVLWVSYVIHLRDQPTISPDFNLALLTTGFLYICNYSKSTFKKTILGSAHLLGRKRLVNLECSDEL